MTSRKTLRELGLELFSRNYKASQKKAAGMIKCFHITVTEVWESSCFCDVPAALYSVFKNCYMNITDMHLLNVSAAIGTLNTMLFEPEKYTKHS